MRCRRGSDGDVAAEANHDPIRPSEPGHSHHLWDGPRELGRFRRGAMGRVCLASPLRGAPRLRCRWLARSLALGIGEGGPPHPRVSACVPPQCRACACCNGEPELNQFKNDTRAATPRSTARELRRAAGQTAGTSSCVISRPSCTRRSITTGPCKKWYRAHPKEWILAPELNLFTFCASEIHSPGCARRRCRLSVCASRL